MFAKVAKVERVFGNLDVTHSTNWFAKKVEGFKRLTKIAQNRFAKFNSKI